MLEAPRELLARALLALALDPEAPEKEPPPRDELLFGMLRSPTRSPPPEGRLALMFLAPALFAPMSLAAPLFALMLPAPARFAPVLLVPPGRDDAGRLTDEAPLRAWACREDAEPPRVLPPYLFAVFLFEYGAPPRWFELCCQLLLPELMLPVLMLLLRTKLLLLLM
jgi:hypothetical protein